MNGISLQAGHYLAVALGGAMGAVLRFWISARLLAVPAMPAWPWGTFSVNLAGSFLFGLLAVWLATTASEQMRFLLMTGLLGAFTTYSTFSFEVVRMVEAQAWSLALGYALGTLVGCIMVAGAGLVLGRWIFE
jgi:CrcB protein